jgi:hypothetical protein
MKDDLMNAELDEILDDLFHGCAFFAFVEQAIAEGGPPDMEITRRRAFQLYEEALAAKKVLGDTGHSD